MEYIITNFASADQSAGGDLFSSIGIDWKLLALQTLAFLILLFILKKFVYPPLVGVLDKREADLKASADAAIEAERHAAEAQSETSKLLEEAKKEAAEIVETARAEASGVVESAQKKAEAKSETMLKNAQEEIAKEVASAKIALQEDALELVALATGKVIDEKIDTKKDSQLITKALKEAK